MADHLLNEIRVRDNHEFQREPDMAVDHFEEWNRQGGGARGVRSTFGLPVQEAPLVWDV